SGPAMVAVAFLSNGAVGQGTFDNLGPGLTASGASANGDLVVGTSPSEYFYWTEETGVVLVGGTSAGNGVGGQAKVSDDGTRMVGTVLSGSSGLYEMGICLLDSGAEWVPLGGIGSSSGGEASSGWGISGDGSTAVGLGWISAGGAHAIRSADLAAPTDLGSTVKGRSSRANGCDGDGSVVVGWQDSTSGFRQGAVWNEGLQTLITLGSSGSALGEAAACSADGSWVVGSGVSTNGWNAWRWSSETGGVNIGTPPSFGWRGASVDISADGSTIVGFYRPFPGPATFGRGFIWNEEDGQQDLTDLAIARGIEIPTGVILALPLGISSDGTTVVGIARGPSGTFGFRLQFGVDCPADFDGDGTVSGGDLATLLAAWGTTNPKIDLTGDGVVGGDDLAVLLSAWGDC
ncbi:MAG: GC-type dockerin domain-anchored protein, partial [Phycisphaerales bacterium]